MKREWLSGLILAVLALLYAVQIFSPLRLSTDSIVFLSLAAEAADSAKWFPLAEHTVFPPVYATMIALLDRAHLAGPVAFVFLNELFLAAGVFFSMLCWRDVFGFSANVCRWMACVLLSAFPLIKHAMLAQSDVMFFGLAMLAIWLLVRAERSSQKWTWHVAALLAIMLAFEARTAAVALVPAFIWAAWPQRWPRWWLLAGGALIPVIGLLALSSTRYFREALARYEDAGSNGLLLQLTGHFTELGELALNLPAERLPGFAQPLVLCAGVALFGTLGIAMWWRRARFGVIEVYLLCYALLIFVWPYRDQRFWIPALPLLLSTAAVVISRLKFAPVTATAWFLVTGFFALAFSTRLAFSGERFPELYGGGSLRAVYEAAWHQQPLPAGDNEAALAVLKRYGSGRSSSR